MPSSQEKVAPKARGSSKLRRLLPLCAFSLMACQVHGAPTSQQSRPPRELLGLSDCSAQGRRDLEIETDEDVTILVHGCNSSAAKFATLAEVFRFHGQKAYCFSYDYRDSIESSARELRASLKQLEDRRAPRDITVIGHSQGGLVARAALTDLKGDSPPQSVKRLVTVSSPFAGIESSSHCGLTALHVVTLGITVGVCQIIAGRKWTEIYPDSPFITQPRSLASPVVSHLMIATQEEGSCLVHQDGKCIQDDFVFNLQEQREDYINEERLLKETVPAGHVEIVGEQGIAPHKLISLLQTHGVLMKTPPRAQQALLARLDELY